MSMGGSQPEVLTTLTTDFGKVLDGIHRTKIRGSAHLSTALNVAQVSGWGALAGWETLTALC